MSMTSPSPRNSLPARPGSPRRTIRLLIVAMLAVLVWPLAAAADADAFELRVSPNSNRTDSAPLEGATLSANRFVFVMPEDGATKMRFWLDNPSRTGTPRTVEGAKPWDFAGTNTDSARTAKPWDTGSVADGPHSITVEIDKVDGGVEVQTANFTVANATNGYALLLSSTSNRADPVPLADASVQRGRSIFVFTSPSTGVTRVRFFLDDPTMSGAPRQTESGAPHDFNGTASNGTAIPFDTAGLDVGSHTITAAVDKSGGGTEVLQGPFSVVAAGCAPVACEDILVDLPYNLDFSANHGFAQDRNGVGTGFTHVDRPSLGTGYDPSKLLVDQAAGQLKITTTSGLASLGTNAQDNALAVGIDAPNQLSVIRSTLVNPPQGTGGYEQAGIWFGNDEDNYVKLAVQSTPQGTKIQMLAEVNAKHIATLNSAAMSLTTSRVIFTLKANPVDRSITGVYRVGELGADKTLGKVTVPGEFFSFDAAGIDPTIGTRSFGGVFASHRNGPAPLTYTFDNFSVTADDTPPPPVSGSAPQFDRVSHTLPNPTSLEWGPDGRLYVSEMMGKIHALTLNADGQVVSDVVSTALGTRLTLGLTIGPESTPSNVVVYASHSNPSLDNGLPNSGVISRLSGASLATRADVITGLPRAKANHATNKIRFGPDGKLYIAQGGNTGAGAPNTANTEFGTMQEQPLSAALLVADLNAAGFDGSCANTTDIFGPAPCDVVPYATGLRNTYDFIFHSNGSIYGPDNGLGVVGTFPPSPTAPCLGNGSTTSWTQGGHNPGSQPDILNRMVQGSYYGHPNPYRSECVFKDGHFQGVSPLPNYKLPVGNLGDNRSANGTTEYTSEAFCGQLKGEILIANYSVGDDITRLRLSADGQSISTSDRLVGGFTDPLPLAAGPSGRLAVGELGTGKVTILKPRDLGCWSSKKPLPANLLDVGGAALGGKLYAVGGKTATGPRSDVNVYDPATDTWTAVAPLPGPAVENPAVVALNGKLYAFGGSTSPFSGAVKNAAVYDPATNAWTQLPQMAFSRGGAGAAAIGGKIYVVGGMGLDGASLASVEVFDTATESWSSGPGMATRRDNPGVAALNGRVYVFGGRTRDANGTTPNGTLGSVEMLDPASGAWVARAPMPTGRRTMMVGTIGGKAQVMGGEASGTGSGVFSANEEYDPATDSWRTLNPMQTPRHGGAAGTIDGVVYVAGGGSASGSSFTNVNEAFRFQG
jgi:large repetitive protein